MKLAGSKKMMMIAGIAILVIGGGAGAFLAGKSMSGSPQKETAEKGVDKEIVEDATKKEGHGEAKSEGHGKEKKEGHGGGHSGEGGGGGQASASSATDLMYQFDKFTVNLMNPNPRGPLWFLVVTIQIKAASAEARAQIEENEAPLRDATITLLTSKTRDEVMPAEGKERIKRELMARYEGILSPGAIQSIYITDIQMMSR